MKVPTESQLCAVVCLRGLRYGSVRHAMRCDTTLFSVRVRCPQLLCHDSNLDLSPGGTVLDCLYRTLQHRGGFETGDSGQKTLICLYRNCCCCRHSSKSYWVASLRLAVKQGCRRSFLILPIPKWKLTTDVPKCVGILSTRIGVLSASCILLASLHKKLDATVAGSILDFHCFPLGHEKSSPMSSPL